MRRTAHTKQAFLALLAAKDACVQLHPPRARALRYRQALHALCVKKGGVVVLFPLFGERIDQASPTLPL